MLWKFFVLFSIYCQWLSDAKESKEDFKKVLNEVLTSLMLDEQLDRYPRSNDTITITQSTPSQTTLRTCTSIYNYWLFQSEIARSREAPKSTTPKEKNYFWLDRLPPSGPALSKIEKLKDEIRYQALVKKTNQEFLSYLDRIIEDKKMELLEEEKEIKDEYAELNRTREALFHAYNRQVRDRSKLDELRKQLSEKQAFYQRLLAMHRRRRWSRDVGLETPWIDINYPGGNIREALRQKKSKYDDDDDEPPEKDGEETTENDDEKIETTTMSLRQLLWRAFGKYLPFRKKVSTIEDASLPLEIHYRVGKDVAHITIKVVDPPKSTTHGSSKLYV